MKYRFLVSISSDVETSTFVKLAMDFQGPLYDVRMRRGQGYNSYIQEPRIDDAVEFVPTGPKKHRNALATQASNGTSADTVTTGTATTNSSTIALPDASKPPPNWNDFFPALLEYMSKDGQASKTQNDKVLPYLKPSSSAQANQTVLFSSKQVKEVTEINEAMGFKASAAVKSGTIGPGAEVGSKLASKGDFNKNTLNFLIHVKVVNERDDRDESWHFNPIDGLAARLEKIPGDDCAHKRAIEFTRIYGDTFISDFVEGGEIYALVGIRSRTVSNINELRAFASAKLTPAAGPFKSMPNRSLLKKVRMLLNMRKRPSESSGEAVERSRPTTFNGILLA